MDERRGHRSAQIPRSRIQRWQLEGAELLGRVFGAADDHPVALQYRFEIGRGR